MWYRCHVAWDIRFLPGRRKIYSFSNTDLVILSHSLEHDVTHGGNITLKILVGRLSSRRSILPYHCGFICFLLFPRSPSNLIRSFGTVDAITTSPGVQHAPVSARNIHSWQMSRARSRQTCHLSTTGPDELRATTSMCYVSNNARKISVNYHYIGWYRARARARTYIPLTESWWTSGETEYSSIGHPKFTCDSTCARACDR